MATAFSGYPACPASPRELVDIRSAAIFEDQLKTEYALASRWGDEYRARLDRDLLRKVVNSAQGGRPRPVTSASPRLPSSSVAARLQGSQIVSLMGTPRDQSPRHDSTSFAVQSPRAKSPRNSNGYGPAARWAWTMNSARFGSGTDCALNTSPHGGGTPHGARGSFLETPRPFSQTPTRSGSKVTTFEGA